MEVKQTDTSNPNAAVLLDENGLCTYGKIPQEAADGLTNDEHAKLSEAVSGVSGTMDDLREAATEALRELGYSEVVWPLPERDLEAIRDGDIPGGLLLTHLEYRTRGKTKTNGTSDG